MAWSTVAVFRNLHVSLVAFAFPLLTVAMTFLIPDRITTGVEEDQLTTRQGDRHFAVSGSLDIKSIHTTRTSPRRTICPPHSSPLQRVKPASLNTMAHR